MSVGSVVNRLALTCFEVSNMQGVLNSELYIMES